MTGGLIARIRNLVSPTPGSAEEGEDSPPRRIRLIVGLGNPGKEYAQNRHNVGYWTVNRLARRHGIQMKTSGQSALGQGGIDGSEVALAKPRTFVNKSGQAVWNLIKRLKIDDARELLVVCDDIDLPVGKVRLRPHGGSGGYKGLQSIIDETKSDEFPRIRIGIGRPVIDGKLSWEPAAVGDYVLSDPPPDERLTLDEAVDRAIEAIEVAVSDGFERAMSQSN